MRFRLRESGDKCCSGGVDTCQNLTPYITPYYGQDHNYADSAWQGEDPATNRKNYPAIRAAKTAGGYTHDITVHNYPTITTKGDQLMGMYNSYQESVCDVLSRVSLQEATKKAKRRSGGGGGSKGGFLDKVKNVAGKVSDTVGTGLEYAGKGLGYLGGAQSTVLSHIPGLRSVNKGFGTKTRELTNKYGGTGYGY